MPTKLLKKCADEVIHVLILLFHIMSIDQGEIPEYCRQVNVSLIYEKGDKKFTGKLYIRRS